MGADVREEKGKSRVKALRKSSIIPAVVYRKGKDAVPIQVKIGDLNKVFKTSGSENILINLKLKGENKDRTVIIKELQYDPVHGKLLHIDFNQILLTEKLRITVPISVKGSAPGVKEGGLLQHIMWEVEVECLPTNIPDKIDVNVSNLNIGDAIHLKELKLPEGVRIMRDMELVVISVAAPVEEKVEEVLPGVAIAEPEVIKEKKMEEEPEEDKKKEKTKE